MEKGDQFAHNLKKVSDTPYQCQELSEFLSSSGNEFRTVGL